MQTTLEGAVGVGEQRNITLLGEEIRLAAAFNLRRDEADIPLTRANGQIPARGDARVFGGDRAGLLALTGFDPQQAAGFRLKARGALADILDRADFHIPCRGERCIALGANLGAGDGQILARLDTQVAARSDAGKLVIQAVAAAVAFLKALFALLLDRYRGDGDVAPGLQAGVLTRREAATLGGNIAFDLDGQVAAGGDALVLQSVGKAV